jgi:hypothetical protein
VPVSEEQEWQFWDEQATAARRGQLAAVQSAAAGWRTLFGALLGVFSAGSFAGGVTTLDKLADPWASLAKAATLVAVASILAATVLANTAAQAVSVETVGGLSGRDLMVRSHRGARVAMGRLRAAKVVGFAAIGVVVVASATVVLVGPAPAKAPTVVVVVDGRVLCGVLSKDSSGLKVNGVALAVGGAPNAVSGLAVVPRCP